MKTKIILNYSFLLFSFFFFNNSHAQTSLSITGASAIYLNVDQTSLDTMNAMDRGLLERRITLTLNLQNPTGINEIAVALGSSEGSNDIFYKEFAYGVNGDFNDGTSYHASGNTITIGIGEYLGAPQYFLEATTMTGNEIQGVRGRYVLE